jgi:hypothetical protein
VLCMAALRGFPSTHRHVAFFGPAHLLIWLLVTEMVLILFAYRCRRCHASSMGCYLCVRKIQAQPRSLRLDATALSSLVLIERRSW